jgi:hypothetical protein
MDSSTQTAVETETEPVAGLVKQLMWEADWIEECREEVAKAKRQHKRPDAYLVESANLDPAAARGMAKGLRSGKLTIRPIEEVEIEVKAFADVWEGKKRVGRIAAELNTEGTRLEAFDPDELRQDGEDDGELSFDRARAYKGKTAR